MQSCARMAFELARGFNQMSVVVDADGLWLVQVGPGLDPSDDGKDRPLGGDELARLPSSDPDPELHGVSTTVREDGSSSLPLYVLTPTKAIDTSADPKTLCPRLARSLQNLTVIQKGATDIISNGTPIPAELLAESAGGSQPEVLEGDVQGGLKRVGGQGDILSGSTGVLMAWGTEWIKGGYS